MRMCVTFVAGVAVGLAIAATLPRTADVPYTVSIYHLGSSRHAEEELNVTVRSEREALAFIDYVTHGDIREPDSEANIDASDMAVATYSRSLAERHAANLRMIQAAAKAAPRAQ